MNISFFIINSAIPEQHSSFNLGVAIATISIFITLISFTLQKRFALRVALRKRQLLVYLLAMLLSLIFLFLVELNLVNKPLYIELIAATLILISIIGFSVLIFSPLKTINKYNVKYLNKELGRFLIQRQQKDILESLSDLGYFYKSLLRLSLKNKHAKEIFLIIFTSKYFLILFSEHGYLFEATIKFYLKNEDQKKYHILNLINQVFVVSLMNKNSFLNSHVKEEIYPDSTSYIDELFFNEFDIDFQKLLFNSMRYDLEISGKIAYISLVERYFKIIYESNNHVSLSKNGYKLNISYNEKLIMDFFKNIKKFFEMEFNEENFDKLWINFKKTAWYYEWGNRTSDKTENIRNSTGTFLYDIFEEAIGRFKGKDDDLLRSDFIYLFSHFIETQENSSETNLALHSFIEKLKAKIISDKFGSNSKGYYPAMLKVYFFIFGHFIFSGYSDQYTLTNLDIPVLLKLKESLPKLYMGFKQEFYDAQILPKEKEEKLQNEGREIIDSYLPNNMVYEYETNSLIYYYSGKNHGSRIELNQFDKNSTTIMVQKV